LQQTADPNVWNDLSVALIASCDDFQALEDCLDGLGAADTALARNGDGGAARFNRALALQRLGLMDDARREWNVALEEDLPPEWRREAENNVLAIQKPAGDWKGDRVQLEAAVARGDLPLVRSLVAAHSRDARAWGEGVYLGQWADAAMAGDRAAADRALAIARAIGESLRRVSGESLLSDAVQHVTDVAHSDDERRQATALAYIRYREGRQKYGSLGPGGAIPILEKSQELFAKSGSPMQFVAAYFVASAMYAANEIDDASTRLDTLAAKHFEQRGYIALSAQIGWEHGLCRLVRGEFSEALDILERSASEFGKLGEDENRASIEDFVAEVHEFTGNPAEAWTVRARALAVIGDERRLVSLATAATARMQRGEWSRAIALLNLRVETALRVANALHAASALVQRSIAKSHLEDHFGAAQDLQLAREWLKAIRDADQHRRVEAELAFGEAIATSDPRSAIDSFSRALEFYRQRDLEVFSAQVLLQRARANRRVGDLQAADADAIDGLASLERQRGSVRDLNDRASMFQSSRDLFVEAIEIARMQNNDAAAFALSERARGRALLDQFERTELGAGRAPQNPSSLDELQSALAADAAIVEYSALSRSLLAFVVRRDRFEVVALPASPTALEPLVRRCSDAAIDGDAAKVRDACGRVASVVLSPIEPALRDLHTVAIVADGPLTALPFRALMDNDQFFGERFAITEAPSATLAVLSAQRARSMRGEQALLIGATEFDRKRFPSLQSLENVPTEIEGLRRRLPKSLTLYGAQVTRDAIERALMSANVVHFAGHAIADDEHPLASQLLLASRSATEDLTASSIAALHLDRTRLVYLSSCRSAAPGVRNDGVKNLALAFIAAGVPSIVASRWDLPDRDAALLATRFHAAALETGDPAKALQRAAPLQERSGSELSAACSIVVTGGSPSLVHP
jgi:CHAT domain-containing protein